MPLPLADNDGLHVVFGMGQVGRVLAVTQTGGILATLAAGAQLARPRNFSWRPKESVMGIVAWIAVGLTAGLLANMLLRGKRSRGLIFICLTCFTGAPK